MSTFNIVYKIEKGDTWRSKDSINIKSNIADDKMIDCELSKTLVDTLVKGAAMLDPDKLLLGFAEAQKRGIELNLEALSDMELTAKTQAEKVTQAINDAYSNTEDQYEELQNKFEETTSRFKTHILNTTKELESEIKKVEKISERLREVDDYSLGRLGETLKKIIEIAEKDKDLLKLVLDYK